MSQKHQRVGERWTPAEKPNQLDKKEGGTVLFKCVDGYKYAFLLSKVCPSNLTRRNLMCKLSLCLISTPESAKVLRLSDLAPNSSQSFVYHTSNMTYAYQWQLQPLTTFPEFVPDRKAAATDFMEPEDLQCISHVSPEPDESYKEGWLRERFDKLTLTHIYWTQHKCAVSVSLTSTKCNMYIMDHSIPHIPLAKHR